LKSKKTLKQLTFKQLAQILLAFISNFSISAFQLISTVYLPLWATINRKIRRFVSLRNGVTIRPAIAAKNRAKIMILVA
jgi:hypothetical protein